jgi:hypothetical protein
MHAPRGLKLARFWRPGGRPQRGPQDEGVRPTIVQEQFLESRSSAQSNRYFQTLSSAQDSREPVTFVSRTSFQVFGP